MNKYDFVRKVAAEAGTSQDVANKVINAVVSVLVPEVRDNGESLTLPGLGTFKQKNSPARKGHNPATGEKIDVPASRTLVFKAQPSIKVKE